MIPSVGRIVHYTISDDQAKSINNRRAQHRADAQASKTITIGVGNPLQGGEVYPMLITRLWTDDPVVSSAVQGQVFFDGNDNLWVTSVQQGEGPNKWFDPNPPVPDRYA